MTDKQVMQQALAALEDERYVTKYTHIVDVITALRKALEQPAQWDKPSASFNEWWDSDSDSKADSANPFRNGSAAYWAWAGWKAAQRPWVGLTHQQTKDCVQGWDGNDAYVLCRAIEIKLKEKNNA